MSPLSHPFFPQALFLDRDGTVIEDRHYLRDPDGVSLLPGVGQALGDMVRAGVRLFLVTNQSGIGRGYFSEADFRACQTRLEELLRPYGASFADVRFCPHGPDEDCACRKPRPGMWEDLRAARNLDPARCVMVGDKPEDMLFAMNAGFAAAFLVRTGHGAESAAKLGLPPADTNQTSMASCLTAAGYLVPPHASTRLECVPDMAAVAAALGLQASADSVPGHATRAASCAR